MHMNTSRAFLNSGLSQKYLTNQENEYLKYKAYLAGITDE